MVVVTRIVLFLSILLLCFTGKGQNYIGLHKDSIRVKMKVEYPTFAFAKEIQNEDRSFIKFENSFEEQTLLFVLNAQGYCTSVSRMYNTWLFNRIKDELNKKYGESKKLIWIEEMDDKEYEVELKKGEWFVTVVTRTKK